MERKQFRVLDHALLKAEELGAAGVGQNGGRLLKPMTEIVEMFLIRRGFLTRISRPLSLEFCRGHLKFGRTIRDSTVAETFSDWERKR